jgi:hypothetical protein
VRLKPCKDVCSTLLLLIAGREYIFGRRNPGNHLLMTFGIRMKHGENIIKKLKLSRGKEEPGIQVSVTLECHNNLLVYFQFFSKRDKHNDIF